VDASPDFKRTKGAIKAHILLDLHAGLPVFVRVSHGKTSDISTLDSPGEQREAEVDGGGVQSEGRRGRSAAPGSASTGNSTRVLSIIDSAVSMKMR
jgi:hypothetical protein